MTFHSSSSSSRSLLFHLPVKVLIEGFLSFIILVKLTSFSVDFQNWPTVSFATILGEFSVHVEKRPHPNFRFPRSLSHYPFLLCPPARHTPLTGHLEISKSHVQNFVNTFLFFSPFSYYSSHHIWTTISTTPPVPGFPVFFGCFSFVPRLPSFLPYLGLQDCSSQVQHHQQSAKPKRLSSNN